MFESQPSIQATSQQAEAKVWVAFAAVDEQFLLELDYVKGMTLADAIEKSQIEKLTQLPEKLEFGIFGIKVKELTYTLCAGDRVEIYRPLMINPKDKRRKRAAENPVGLYCRGNRFKLSK